MKKAVRSSKLPLVSDYELKSGINLSINLREAAIDQTMDIAHTSNLIKDCRKKSTEIFMSMS